MKLAEELRKQYKNLSDFQIEVIVEIAKQWALEMVGEDEPGVRHPERVALRQEIRDRIKEESV